MQQIIDERLTPIPELITDMKISTWRKKQHLNKTGQTYFVFLNACLHVQSNVTLQTCFLSYRSINCIKFKIGPF